MYFVTFPSLAHRHSCISVYTVIHNTHKHIHKYTESFICFDPFVFSVCFKLNLKVWFSFFSLVCFHRVFSLFVSVMPSSPASWPLLTRLLLRFNHRMLSHIVRVKRKKKEQWRWTLGFIDTLYINLLHYSHCDNLFFCVNTQKHLDVYIFLSRHPYALHSEPLSKSYRRHFLSHTHTRTHTHTHLWLVHHSFLLELHPKITRKQQHFEPMYLIKHWKCRLACE